MIRFYPYKDMYQMHMNRSWEKSRSISLIHVLTYVVQLQSSISDKIEHQKYHIF